VPTRRDNRREKEGSHVMYKEGSDSKGGFWYEGKKEFPVADLRRIMKVIGRKKGGS